MRAHAAGGATRQRTLYRRAVWVSLDTWLIGDGQFPQLALGDVVRDCGLRLRCSRLHRSGQQVPAISDSRVDDEGRARYQLTGRCQSVTSAMAVLIAMPGWLTVAEPETCRAVSEARDQPAYEPWSEQFRPPAPNEMLDAEGWLEVVAEHEWDAFAIPDSRMSWRLQGIQLLEHRMMRVPGEPDARMRGPVVRTTQPKRLSWTAERLLGGRYLIDVVPA